MTAFWGIALGSGISTAVGLLGWLTVRRTVETRDRDVRELRGDVEELRQHRVSRLEQDLREHALGDDGRHIAANSSRKSMHEAIGRIEREFVHKAECERDRSDVMKRLGEFGQSVLVLERVSERTDMAMKRGEQLLQQLINLNAEVCTLTGRVEALNGRSKPG